MVKTDEKKMKFTVTVEVSEHEVNSVINDVILNIDLFRMDYCGYWMQRVATKMKGRQVTEALVYEHGDDPAPSDEESERVEKLWRAGKKLPERWHVLNREVGMKAIEIGLSRWGLPAWENAWDASRMDVVVQMALGVTYEDGPKYG